MSIPNRREVGATLLSSLLCSSGAWASAPAFPTKAVSVVVGFPPGGATDVTARVLQPQLQRLLGQPAIVENVPGAGGSIGVQRMLNTGGDGHTVFIGTPSDTVLAPLAIAAARYKAENLKLIALLGASDFAVVVRPTLNVTTVDDLVRQGRAAQRSFSYASFGNGSLYHLIGEDLRARASMDLLHVPFQGMGPTINSVMGNQVDLAFLPLAGQTVGLIRDNRVKALAITSTKRSPLLPNIPTVDESTLLKGFIHNVWVGIFAPASLPPAISTHLNRITVEAMNGPEYIRLCNESGSIIPDPHLSLAQAERFYNDEVAKYHRMAKSIKLEPT